MRNIAGSGGWRGTHLSARSAHAFSPTAPRGSLKLVTTVGAVFIVVDVADKVDLPSNWLRPRDK